MCKLFVSQQRVGQGLGLGLGLGLRLGLGVRVSARHYHLRTLQNFETIYTED